jgi:hypothetical protein
MEIVSYVRQCSGIVVIPFIWSYVHAPVSITVLLGSPPWQMQVSPTVSSPSRLPVIFKKKKQILEPVPVPIGRTQDTELFIHSLVWDGLQGQSAQRRGIKQILCRMCKGAIHPIFLCPSIVLGFPSPRRVNKQSSIRATLDVFR